MQKKVIKLILVILCMITIFMFSSDKDYESSRKSNSIITGIADVFSKKKLSDVEKDRYINKYVFVVRKTAHFTIYLILGLLVISLLKEYMIISWKSVFFSLLIVFLYACSDEFHQLFVSGRSCEFRDVLIDSSGGFVGSCIYYLFYSLRRRKHE